MQEGLGALFEKQASIKLMGERSLLIQESVGPVHLLSYRPVLTPHNMQTTGNNTPACSSHLLLVSGTKTGTIAMPCNQPVSQVMRAHEYV